TRLARGAEVRLERDRVERGERVDRSLDLARGAQQAEIRSGVADHREVGDVRPQQRADDRHRLAPAPPAADADGHPRAQLADDLAAIAPATSSAAARSSSRGTTFKTEPNACSSAAVAVADVYTIARILCCGTRRLRWVAAPRAPRSTSGKPKVASSDATITSA